MNLNKSILEPRQQHNSLCDWVSLLQRFAVGLFHNNKHVFTSLFLIEDRMRSHTNFRKRSSRVCEEKLFIHQRHTFWLRIHLIMHKTCQIPTGPADLQWVAKQTLKVVESLSIYLAFQITVPPRSLVSHFKNNLSTGIRRFFAKWYHFLRHRLTFLYHRIEVFHCFDCGRLCIFVFAIQACVPTRPLQILTGCALVLIRFLLMHYFEMTAANFFCSRSYELLGETQNISLLCVMRNLPPYQ